MRSKKIDKERIFQLIKICKQVRVDSLSMAHRSRSPHIGPALSCVEILVALYHHVMKVDSGDPLCKGRDRFILSKGHAAMALYACLHRAGYINEEKLFSYCENGSELAEHPLANKLPCIEFATGSLGHGLSIGIGIALASRLRETPYYVYVLMGDGECNEGSVWEAAGLATALRLNNLVAIVDYNKMQATDRYDRLSGGYDLKDVFRSFGWRSYEVDGHNVREIIKVFDDDFFKEKRPKVIMAHTIKGKGVSFMENDLEWHYRPPSSNDLKNAIKELNKRQHTTKDKS